MIPPPPLGAQENQAKKPLISHHLFIPTWGSLRVDFYQCLLSVSSCWIFCLIFSPFLCFLISTFQKLNQVISCSFLAVNFVRLQVFLVRGKSPDALRCWMNNLCFFFFFLMKRSWFNEYALFRECALILKIINVLTFVASCTTFVKQAEALKSTY